MLGCTLVNPTMMFVCLFVCLSLSVCLSISVSSERPFVRYWHKVRENGSKYFSIFWHGVRGPYGKSRVKWGGLDKRTMGLWRVAYCSNWGLKMLKNEWSPHSLVTDLTHSPYSSHFFFHVTHFSFYLWVPSRWLLTQNLFHFPTSLVTSNQWPLTVSPFTGHAQPISAH